MTARQFNGSGLASCKYIILCDYWNKLMCAESCSSRMRIFMLAISFTSGDIVYMLQRQRDKLLSLVEYDLHCFLLSASFTHVLTLTVLLVLRETVREFCKETDNNARAQIISFMFNTFYDQYIVH